MGAPSSRAREIVVALVGPEHRQRYTMSPSFRQAVDTLVAMLPAWVDGLAAQSDEADRRIAAAAEALARSPIGPFPMPDVDR